MARPFHLQALVNMARDRSEVAAQALGKLKQTWVEAQSKQAQLQAYLEEYRSRLQQQTQAGFSIMQWRDYQSFIHKLELAIVAQGKEIERCRQLWESGQVKWQACERDVNAYQALRNRHDEAERKIDARQDQGLQDEFARNQHQRKMTPP